MGQDTASGSTDEEVLRLETADGSEVGVEAPVFVETDVLWDIDVTSEFACEETICPLARCAYSVQLLTHTDRACPALSRGVVFPDCDTTVAALPLNMASLRIEDSFGFRVGALLSPLVRGPLWLRTLTLQKPLESTAPILLHNHAACLPPPFWAVAKFFQSL